MQEDQSIILKGNPKFHGGQQISDVSMDSSLLVRVIFTCIVDAVAIDLSIRTRPKCTFADQDDVRFLPQAVIVKVFETEVPTTITPAAATPTMEFANVRAP